MGSPRLSLPWMSLQAVAGYSFVVVSSFGFDIQLMVVTGPAASCDFALFRSIGAGIRFVRVTGSGGYQFKFCMMS